MHAGADQRSASKHAAVHGSLHSINPALDAPSLSTLPASLPSCCRPHFPHAGQAAVGGWAGGLARACRCGLFDMGVASVSVIAALPWPSPLVLLNCDSIASPPCLQWCTRRRACSAWWRGRRPTYRQGCCAGAADPSHGVCRLNSAGCSALVHASAGPILHAAHAAQP